MMPKKETTTQRGYGHAYQLARKRLLAGNPWCHWCLLEGRRTPATTADHDPPISVVGHPHGRLVPACGPCNFGHRQRKAYPPPSRVW